MPYLIEVITSPIAFWNELKIRFHWSDNHEEQIIIVKTLICMYQKHFQMIKELSWIAYWVKSLGNKKYTHLHFWILQLIYTALCIPFEEYAKANYKMFKKANGLSTIFGMLNFTFKELLKRRESIENEISVANIKMSNFTGLKENLNYFERNSIEINQAIIIINILDRQLEKIDDFNCVPLPSFFQYLFKKRSINWILQLFLIENNDLIKVVTSFIFKHFKWQYSLSLLIENGLIEYLIFGMHTKSKNKIMKIIDSVNQYFPDYNDDIDFEEMISEEEKLTFSKLEPSSKIKIKAHPLWRFLPVTLLDLLEAGEHRMFIDIYIHDDIQSEFIVWNKQYRETLLNYMRGYFESQVQQLIQFVSEEFEFVRVPGNLPLYTDKLTKVVKYDKLDKEMKIGRFYARMWVKNASSIQMTNDELNEFYLKVDSQIRSCVNSDLINDSKENIQDTIERFVLCTKIIMKLNDVFKYK